MSYTRRVTHFHIAGKCRYLKWVSYSITNPKYAFDGKGRAYHKLARDGTPLHSRPGDIFAESFIILALAEYAKASGKEEYLQRAEKLYWDVIGRLQSRELDKYGSVETPLYKEHAPGMIMMNTTQELRAVRDDPRYTELINDWVKEELYIHARDEQQAMFERVGLDGIPILTEPEGRSITPGHCLESCWFCIEEGLYQETPEIVQRACEVMEWTMRIGWDEVYGGIFNFVDYEGKPPGHHDEGWGEDQDWDEKLFWVHSEALYALLLAHKVSNEEKFMDWYEKVHYWAFEYFPDPEYGEWFGYLRRDGSVSQTLKGCVKGFFHLPRALLKCMLLLEK
ncbi:AGE family epimerase/isomerase [Candidatus Poribacteria bacterium]